jgi:N-acetylmuramoyl-L-alanine amidase
MTNFIKTNKLLSFCFFIISTTVISQNNQFKVTLDAGHGAHDYGAVYSGRIEKNIALAIVLKVGKLLEDDSKIDVSYTRKTDVFIDLVERANIANKFNAHLFVSIHCNANKNTSAFGTETYVMGMNKIASNLEAAKNENSVITLESDYKTKYQGFDPNNPDTMIGMTLMQEEYLDNSISIASKVQEEFAKLGKRIRGEGGVKQAPFMVLHKAYMPRILIETGFVSNPEEGNLLNSEAGQNEIAKAIATAIIRYRNEYFGDGNFTVAAPKVAPVKQIDPIIVTTFKVQLVALSRKLPANATFFRKLTPITSDVDSGVYKYYYGSTTDYNQALALKEHAHKVGFKNAYLIAYQDGKKVNIQDVIK